VWEGKPLRQWPRRALARRVAYLPQAPLFDAEQTVSDPCASVAPVLGCLRPGNLARRRRRSAGGKTLSLDDLMDRRMDELSGGQRQRVSSAVA